MTVSIFYPDADPESTSVDGYTKASISENTFSVLRGSAGTDAVSDSFQAIRCEIDSGGTTDKFTNIFRAICLFDTAAIPDSDTISAAVIAFQTQYFGSAFGGSPEIDIVSSAPASNTTLVAADHGTLGTTVFASRLCSDISTPDIYYDWALDAGGIAALTKTGVSKFGARVSWDTDNSFGGTWTAFDFIDYEAYGAEKAGTTQDPKLTVTHAAASTFTPRAVVIT